MAAASPDTIDYVHARGAGNFVIFFFCYSNEKQLQFPSSIFKDVEDTHTFAQPKLKSFASVVRHGYPVVGTSVSPPVAVIYVVYCHGNVCGTLHRYCAFISSAQWKLLGLTVIRHLYANRYLSVQLHRSHPSLYARRPGRLRLLPYAERELLAADRGCGGQCDCPDAVGTFRG